jgi:2-C-methyl-D-erythritol 2,4-cyclodiphosphate synthase
MTVRVGFGFDAHRLSEGRPLILGGIKIDHSRGLEGHSDADVLIHAIVDAIIGAMARGDIGTHFPDTDEANRGADSAGFLIKVVSWLEQEGMIINNMDATIVAQRPRLSEHIPAMRKRLSELIGLNENLINIKAKTTEGMGFCGREEGIAAYAVVSVNKGESVPR